MGDRDRHVIGVHLQFSESTPQSVGQLKTTGTTRHTNPFQISTRSASPLTHTKMAEEAVTGTSGDPVAHSPATAPQEAEFRPGRIVSSSHSHRS